MEPRRFWRLPGGAVRFVGKCVLTNWTVRSQRRRSRGARVRKQILGGIAVSASLGMVLASGAFAGGNGAQRSGLSPQSGDNNSQCVKGSGAGTNGFAIVNAPGKPGEARFVNGEVSLKRGPADSVFTVWVATDSSHCTMDGMLTTNGQGNGNAHLNTAGTSGTYYVVLKNGTNEAFATAPVTAN